MAERYRALLTAPLSASDFALRCAFFALAPFFIVAAAALFPVYGVLADVLLTLLIFLVGAGARRMVLRVRALRALFARALAFETYYSRFPPRPFLYYALYPLLFPYWLLDRRARREFVLFRGYMLGAVVILLALLVWQYFMRWRPELTVIDFLPTVVVTLIAQGLLVLSLLMPLATTVVWYHSSARRKRLVVLLLVGLCSTGAALWHVSSRRDPLVSYSTRQRVRLRSGVAPDEAHRVLLAAARGAAARLARGGRATKEVAPDGKVEGFVLERAREELLDFYKSDEVEAFDLWIGRDAEPNLLRDAEPRLPRDTAPNLVREAEPRLLVLYSEGWRRGSLLWVAVDAAGEEFTGELPRGALRALRRAADGTEPLLPFQPPRRR